MLTTGPAAGTAAPPSASSRTITETQAPLAEDDYGGEAPAAEAVAEEGDDAIRRELATIRAYDIIAARDRAERERKAAAQNDDLFDWDPGQLPAAPPAPKTEPNRGPPLVREALWQGSPEGTAAAPEQSETDITIVSIGGIIGAAILWFGAGAIERRRGTLGADLRVKLAKFSAWRRRNSALFIGIGASIIAASLTVLRHPDLPYEYSEVEDLLDAGWLTFIGAIVAIMGAYDKISSPPGDQI